MSEDDWIKIERRQSAEDMRQFGPTTTVGIGLPGSHSPLRSVLGQIDTGAGVSAISQKLVNDLGLEPVDFGTAHLPIYGEVSALYYSVRIFFHGVERDVDVVGLSTLNSPHDFLMGRDMLEQTRVVIDFLGGAFAVHFRKS